MAARSVSDTLESIATQFEQDAAAIRKTLAILTRRKETRAVEALPAKLATAIRGERQRKAAKPKASTKPQKLTKTAARRTRTQQFLEMFHEGRPSTPAAVYERLLAKGFSVKDATGRMRSMGALVRRDYLKKVGPHQYTRTDRAFTVNGNGASAPA